LAYDANGNRTAVERRTTATDVTSAQTDSYARTAGTNRLASITTTAGTRSIAYDARGNTLSETRPSAITVAASYDGYGRLLSYTRTGDASQANVYNGLDERVTVTSGTTIRRFVYDAGGRVLGEYGISATDVIAERIWMTPEVSDGGVFGGDDGTGGYAPIAIVTGTTLNWVHGNHLGVPQVYTNATGAVIATPAYTLPGFPGQFRTLSDIYYNKHRDYDISTGRYIQADPIGLSGGTSPYLYAAGNPVRYTDPSGRIVPLALCGIGAVVGGAGTAIGELLGSGATSLSHVGIGAATGCAAGVSAPVVATTAVGAVALGAIANASQYAVTRYVDGKAITSGGVVINFILGGVGGRIGGAFEARGLEYLTDVLPWQSTGTRELFRRINEQRLIDAARRDAFRSILAGSGTTVAGGLAE
jgi:RHS repeat-associated protein